MSHTLPTPSPTVLCKELEEGAVLFCSRTEVYFGLNPVGVVIWKTLSEGPRTLGALVEALQARYPDQEPDVLRADVREFVEALTESELLIADGAHRADP